MKDIDLQIKEAFIKNNDNIEIPVEYKQMINNTLENLPSKTNRKHSKIFNFIIGLIATIFSITGVCFATSAISEHIKQNINQGKISSNDYNQILNSGLDWDNDYENGFYFKMIENLENYQKYKNALNNLPDMSKEDFDNNFILIISSSFRRDPGQANLIIKDISSTEDTTNITLKQLENIEDYTKYNNDIIYAISSKENLKQNRKITIENFTITIPNMKPIKELPIDYTVEGAIKDGCIVAENGILKSNNIDKLDNLINLSYLDNENYVRIYNKVSDKIQIFDIMWIEGIYYLNWTTINNPEQGLQYHSFETLNKDEFELPENKTIIYGGFNKDFYSDDSTGFCILIIYE